MSRLLALSAGDFYSRQRVLIGSTWRGWWVMEKGWSSSRHKEEKGSQEEQMPMAPWFCFSWFPGGYWAWMYWLLLVWVLWTKFHHLSGLTWHWHPNASPLPWFPLIPIQPLCSVLQQELSATWATSFWRIPQIHHLLHQATGIPRSLFQT